jgi:two-component system nitrogen regulation response regulator GlnG
VHGRVLALVERELIARALRHTHGHQAQASELLGINRATLRHKLRELGIALDKVVTGRPEEPAE